ncbi:uncharacterized protein LTR77_002025 [Saxophila tyrrhenica]|uniref:Nucleotide-diphospho-sugar transferase n=1 Tax=Saxophila tyrrhenica TaxID=1690608 RepID=A0AAV9PHX2_9PEZI|nr:hypothetical protein LTR77_002025 [Saxophila tyrrhenica]
MLSVIAGCAVSILFLLCAFPAWHLFTSAPPTRRPLDLDARIERLVRYNQHLQHALAQATESATEPITAAVPNDPRQDAFAYVFYATSDPYACSVLVNIERLEVLESSLAIHVLLSSDVSRQYLEAFRQAGATVHVRDPPPLAKDLGGYYKDCLLKLLAFKMHVLSPGLERILVLDSDQLVLQNMDALFDGLPEVDLAAPRAYWLSKDFLASTFMMVCLSDRLWDSVQNGLASIEYNKFDMDLINDLLGDTVMMLSGKYATLNSHWEDWNLPKWLGSTINMTTVDAVNKLVRPQLVVHKAPPPPQGTFNDKRGTVDGAAMNAAVDGVPQPDRVADSSHAIEVDEPATTASEPLLGGLPDGSNPEVAQPLPSASPRFPTKHPITQELYLLFDTAAVLHFSAVGKPWIHTEESLAWAHPDAHPLLAKQMEMWRETALKVCPGELQFAQ